MEMQMGAEKRNMGSSIQKLMALKKAYEEDSQNFDPNRENKVLRIPWLTKPKSGKKVNLRVLPIKGAEYFAISTKVHRGLLAKYPNIGLVCPNSVDYARKCIVCQWAFATYKEVKQTNDEGLIKYYKKFLPQTSMTAIFYNYDTKRVEKWGISQTMFGQMLADCDEDMDISDIYNGKNGVITCVSVNKKDTYNFHASDTASPLLDGDEKNIREVLDYLDAHQKDIDSISTPKSDIELQKLIDALKDPDSNLESGTDKVPPEDGSGVEDEHPDTPPVDDAEAEIDTMLAATKARRAAKK